MYVCVCARARGAQVVTGQDVTPEKPCKRVNISAIIADIKFRGVTSGVSVCHRVLCVVVCVCVNMCVRSVSQCVCV